MIKISSRILFVAASSIFIRSTMTSASYFHPNIGIKYLNQKEAQSIDEELFNDYAFSVDQLMELAGLSCAVAFAKSFPLLESKSTNVLVVCGPGNNGGDGLVCARHLKLFGYNPAIFCPKQTDKPLYQNLTIQCSNMDIIFHKSLPDLLQIDYIIDAIFGFSFKGPARPEFSEILTKLSQSGKPILSVDVPSGWEIEGEKGGILSPQILVSLTAPKLCARYFSGLKHFLGGRFVPPKLAKKYDLRLPSYPGTDVVVELVDKKVEL